MKVSFYLHNQTDTTGRKAIYCSYSHDSETFRFPVKYDNEGGVIRFNPEAWIKNSKDLEVLIKARKASKKDNPFRVKREHPLAPVINIRLNSIEEEIYGLCNELLLNSKVPFCFEIKTRWQERNKKIDIWAVWDLFIEHKKRTAGKTTVYNFEVFEADLSKFEEIHPIRLNRLDDKFLLNYRDYLSNRGNSLATIQKKVQYFKTFLFWALRNEYTQNDKFKHWRIDKQKAITDYLRTEEIERIRNLNLPEPLHTARNILLFSCFTGMRKGEIESLTPLSERNGVLIFQTGKVKGGIVKPRSVKLNDLSLPLWNEIKKERVVISAYTTDLIKKVGELAGINELSPTTKGKKVEKYKTLSVTTGRRTFITLSHQFGIPENFIAIIAGHARRSMTAHYDKTEIQKTFEYLEKWPEYYYQSIA